MKVTVSQAIAYLNQGEVVALPTETVYGLAASLHHTAAIEQVFKLKGRPLANPLIIHVAHLHEIQEYALAYPPDFEMLAQAFWPGPLTLILPIKTDKIDPLVRANLATAGFRIPDHAQTLEVIEGVGPLVMPSANLSGRPSSTRAEHIEQDFGKDFPVLCGGNCVRGLESTILYYQEPAWKIVRMGSLAAGNFKSILGYAPENLAIQSEAKPLCPGQLYRHYAPKARLLLNKRELNEASHILGFEERVYPEGKYVIYLGSIKDPKQVAANLYQVLRQLDQEEIPEIWVDMDFPLDGLWGTISERLIRAAG